MLANFANELLKASSEILSEKFSDVSRLSVKNLSFRVKTILTFSGLAFFNFFEALLLLF